MPTEAVEEMQAQSRRLADEGKRDAGTPAVDNRLTTVLLDKLASLVAYAD